MMKTLKNSHDILYICPPTLKLLHFNNIWQEIKLHAVSLVGIVVG